MRSCSDALKIKREIQSTDRSNILAKQLLLRSQMNEIFELVTRVGINHSSLIWKTDHSVATVNLFVNTLVHSPSGYYFIFDFKSGKHYCKHSPGVDRQVSIRFPGSWDLQKNYCLEWLDKLAKEIEAPDLWGALTNQTELVSGMDSIPSDNSNFSNFEKEKIISNLKELLEYIKSTGIDNEQKLGIIEDRIRYLQEASDRLGRKDWIGLAAGVLMNIAVAAAFAPERTQEIFRFAGRILSWILHQPTAIP